MNYRISRTADTDIERICDRVSEVNPDAAAVGNYVIA